jgi:hypothetical protein
MTRGQKVALAHHVREQVQRTQAEPRVLRPAESFSEFIANLSDPAWLIEGVFERDTLVSLFGPSGNYKSFVALDMSLSIAAGRKFLGRYPTRQGPTFYLATEGGRGLRRRAAAWANHHGIDATTIPARLLVDSPQITNPENLGNLVYEIKRGPVPVLITIDTLAGTNAGREENASADMTEWVEAAKALQRKFACSVLVVTHTQKHLQPGQVQSERGHSSLRAALDTSMSVGRKGDIITVSCAKQKDAEEFQPIVMTTREVRLVTPQGKTLSSLVLVPATDETEGALGFKPFKVEPLPRVTLDTLPETFTREQAKAALNTNSNRATDEFLNKAESQGLIKRNGPRKGYTKTYSSEAPLAA